MQQILRNTQEHPVNNVEFMWRITKDDSHLKDQFYWQSKQFQNITSE